MNGGGEGEKMEEEKEKEKEKASVVDDMKSEGDVEVEEKTKEKSRAVLMWGYLPGATAAQRSPLVSPVEVRLPDATDSWKDVCGGGCGFAMAISESGKIITWGSADDQGQSYLTSGKHGETPEPISLPTEAPIVKAAAGWAHCASVTDRGEVYTWGWKECVPSGKITRKLLVGGTSDCESLENQNSVPTEQVNHRSQGPKSTAGSISHPDDKKPGDDNVKRRKTLPAKEEVENTIGVDETHSAPPCAVSLDPGVRIHFVAAGGRHTLALSDVGQVWGWGYGGEGQLGLGSRIKMVASPHLIPCMEPSSHTKGKSSVVHQGTMNLSSDECKTLGRFVKGIACGGRHSAVVTDSGVLLTFGWGMYGQCGQGNTNDVLKPTIVSSLLDVRTEAVAAGLWHTVCISKDGHVHVFGGNQFGQLGLGTAADQAEDLPKILDTSALENKNAKVVSCGARHSMILTEDNVVYGWGWNKYGQLGLGDTIDRNIPSEVPIKSHVPTNLACGWWHTLLLAEPLS